MSIFTSIGNAFSSIYNTVRDVVNRNSSRQTGAALDYNNPVNNQLQQNIRSGGGFSAYMSSPKVYVPTQERARIVPQVYRGSTGQGSNQNVNAQNYGYVPSSMGGAVSAGGEADTYIQPRLSKEESKSYLRSAGLGGSGINVEGLTSDEAQALVDDKKAEQKAQLSALTSYTFSSDAPSKTSKRISDFQLRLNDINNDSWSSSGTKKDKITAELNSTAKDIADMYDSPEAITNAYYNNENVKKAIDSYIQAGGSDQMILDKFAEKQTQPAGKTMSTSDYLASLNGSTAQQPTQDSGYTEPVPSPYTQSPNSKLIQDEIARESNIPDDLRKLYFGDEQQTGLLQQRINQEKERIKLIEEKLDNQRDDLRAQANYQIDKNNAELEVAKSEIEQKRLNAKNYITGMLSKLGALITTGAAPVAIATLDQKYEQQKMDAEQKVNFANREIRNKLRNAINEVDDRANELKQKAREDLSKDQEDVLKEINKAERDASKRIFDLSVRFNNEIKKNNDAYKADATTLAENYTKTFMQLVGGGFDPSRAAKMSAVKLSAADSRVAAEAKINDPSAIAYFKALPTQFKNEWIQFAAQQPSGTVFTIEDIKLNYEPYRLQEQSKNTKKTTTTDREP